MYDCIGNYLIAKNTDVVKKVLKKTRATYTCQGKGFASGVFPGIGCTLTNLSLNEIMIFYYN